MKYFLKTYLYTHTHDQLYSIVFVHVPTMHGWISNNCSVSLHSRHKYSKTDATNVSTTFLSDIFSMIYYFVLQKKMIKDSIIYVFTELWLAKMVDALSIFVSIGLIQIDLRWFGLCGDFADWIEFKSFHFSKLFSQRWYTFIPITISIRNKTIIVVATSQP